MTTGAANPDEVSAPWTDIKQQDPGGIMPADVAEDDPDKVKKMTTDHQEDGGEAGEE